MTGLAPVARPQFAERTRFLCPVSVPRGYTESVRTRRVLKCHLGWPRTFVSFCSYLLLAVSRHGPPPACAHVTSVGPRTLVPFSGHICCCSQHACTARSKSLRLAADVCFLLQLSSSRRIQARAAPSMHARHLGQAADACSFFRLYLLLSSACVHHALEVTPVGPGRSFHFPAIFFSPSPGTRCRQRARTSHPARLFPLRVTFTADFGICTPSAFTLRSLHCPRRI
jgi:hypothetical protein